MRALSAETEKKKSRRKSRQFLLSLSRLAAATAPQISLLVDAVALLTAHPRHVSRGVVTPEYRCLFTIFIKQIDTNSSYSFPGSVRYITGKGCVRGKKVGCNFMKEN